MARLGRQHSFALFFINAAFLVIVVVVAQQMSARNLAATNAVAGDAPEEVTFSVADEFEREKQNSDPNVENDYVIGDLSEQDQRLAVARTTSDVSTTGSTNSQVEGRFFNSLESLLANESSVVAGTLFVSAFVATAAGIYFFLKPTRSDVYY